MIWMSLQDEGRILREWEELMLSVTKEHNSFAHFFKTKGGMLKELYGWQDIRIGDMFKNERFRRGEGR